MRTFIVCTNFSETSRNALSYACSFIKSRASKELIDLLLLHVFTIPANYSGDGIALVTVNNSLTYAEEDLNEELEWVGTEYAGINVTGKVTTGRLLDGLKEQIEETRASLVIIGTGGNYGELWAWDSKIINTLYNLPVPVLTVPPNVFFTAIENISFACNLKNIDSNTPFNALINFVTLAEAKLQVVYVTEQEIKPGSIEKQNELLVQSKLRALQANFHTLYENQVVGAIGRFVEEKQVQLLVVIPKRHGVWESLFRKSHTKELSRINRLPVMALH